MQCFSAKASLSVVGAEIRWNGFAELQNTAQLKYKGNFFHKTKDLQKLLKQHLQVIAVAKKLTLEDENKIADEKLSKAKSDIEEIIGFTNFIKVLSDSVSRFIFSCNYCILLTHFIALQKKLIIGHNMFLDVLYTMRQFFNPNMTTLKEFKHTTHKMFPK